jgi:hypothetical protein
LTGGGAGVEGGGDEVGGFGVVGGAFGVLGGGFGGPVGALTGDLAGEVEGAGPDVPFVRAVSVVVPGELPVSVKAINFARDTDGRAFAAGRVRGEWATAGGAASSGGPMIGGTICRVVGAPAAIGEEGVVAPGRAHK